MSAHAVPEVPPRPSRSQAQEHLDGTTNGSTLGSNIPKIPPRPANRSLDRSRSPNRDSFARSPLNEPSFINHIGPGKSPLYSNESANVSGDFLSRPSSVVMPSIGQEGSEYAEAFAAPSDSPMSPTQTRNIANDLQLYAPKPSLPATSAKQRVSTVTRTDSGQAALMGLGNASGDDRNPQARSLKSRSSSVSLGSTNGTERPSSTLSDSEHGIPEIGQRVPMYPNAGDVQAPSPSPYSQQFPAGVGFHNDGSRPRHHGRKSSQKGFEGPPGSYGLHGHGHMHKDPFEKAYYEKHPELLKKETGHYSGALGDGPREWAMSSEDLNKIVRDTASRGAGIGTSPAIQSTPSEDIGYLASEEYASRHASPGPPSIYGKKSRSNSEQANVDSPLKNESTLKINEGSQSGSVAPESEAEDDDVIHVDVPDRPGSRVYASDGYVQSSENLGIYAGDNEDAQRYSAPILAPDEVAKDQFGFELQPAVSPQSERRGSGYDFEQLRHFRSQSNSSSRTTSRPGSIHGITPSIRLPTEYELGHSTPLEDLHEYEPLFTEDEGRASKPKTTADKLKARPDLKNRKFPSQDVWEDTPPSALHTATVSTPQLPADNSEEGDHMRGLHEHDDETPEQAFARKQEELAEQEAEDSESFLNPAKPWAKQSHLVSETRPTLKQRFPSRDVWEDSPDSTMLTTTVNAPQDESDALSPPEERPTTGAVAYHQEKLAAGFPLGAEEGRATTGISAVTKPQIPARPTKAKPTIHADTLSGSKSTTTSPTASENNASGLGPKPAIPERSKPQVPARPAKPAATTSSEQVPLSKVISSSSVNSIDSDAPTKVKPAVPSRPIGSKIAALQGGFMSDLNKRLQLGPQAPKKEESTTETQDDEKEKAPLSDTRKGRARGPVRRAPAKSAALVESPLPTSGDLSFSGPSTLWQIYPDDDDLRATTYEGVQPVRDDKAANSSTPTLATNSAGQGLHNAAEVAPGAEVSSSLPSATQDAHAEEAEETRKRALNTSEGLGTTFPINEGDTQPVMGSYQSEGVDGNIGDNVSPSTATIKPIDKETKDDVTQTGEQIIHMNSAAEHPAAETGAKLVAYLGGQAPDDGNVVVEETSEKKQESMPGSFE
ncbi:MAG: hypothetical protein M1818_005198 [Claussenomyces sp. TS43310]|nr:MAG: hypothetical protein M1818_005198 [Claussenomyces sp. TS43310]